MPCWRWSKNPLGREGSGLGHRLRQHLLHGGLQEVVGWALLAVLLVRRDEIVLDGLVDDVLDGRAPAVDDGERAQDLLSLTPRSITDSGFDDSSL